MENHELEAIIAAILAVGVAGGEGTTPWHIVDKYRRVLKQIQSDGGIYETEATKRGDG